MTTPVVWTERESSGQAWADCTYCSLLMAIVGSGFDAFPLGAHTEPERHAYRGGDARNNFAGGVERARARYGVAIISPAPMTQAQLRTALSSTGRVYAVAGKLANFPAGHSLRRWAPNFTGFHAVAVMPLGNGQVRWLDPLAPNKYAGDTASVADVTDRFALGNYPNDARYMPLGEEIMRVPVGQFAQLTNKKTATRYPDAPFLAEPRTDAVVIRKYPAGTIFYPVNTVTLGTSTVYYGGWLWDDSPSSMAFGYFHGSQLAALTVAENPPDPTAPTPPAADCAAQVAAEHAKWVDWLEARPSLGLEDWLEGAPA